MLDIGTLKYIKQKLTELKKETNIVQSGLRTLLPHSQQWIDHPDWESIGESRFEKQHKPNFSLEVKLWQV